MQQLPPQGGVAVSSFSGYGGQMPPAAAAAPPHPPAQHGMHHAARAPGLDSASVGGASGFGDSRLMSWELSSVHTSSTFRGETEPPATGRSSSSGHHHIPVVPAPQMPTQHGSAAAVGANYGHRAAGLAGAGSGAGAGAGYLVPTKPGACLRQCPTGCWLTRCGFADGDGSATHRRAAAGESVSQQQIAAFVY